MIDECDCIHCGKFPPGSKDDEGYSLDKLQRCNLPSDLKSRSPSAWGYADRYNICPFSAYGARTTCKDYNEERSTEIDPDLEALFEI